MDFKEFYERFEKYQKTTSWGDITLSNHIQEQNKCSFVLKSSHAGKPFYGEIFLHQNGILELTVYCKKSEESKGIFTIGTTKRSNVWLFFSEVKYKTSEEIHDIIYKAAVYLKREYKKNFK